MESVKRRPRQHDEPEPADPDYEDQRAGDLTVGSYTYTWLYDKDRPVPPKRPFGFGVQP